MNKISQIILLLFGLLWVVYAIPVRSANETGAVSNAMQLEHDLRIWANQHADEDAVDEIFGPDNKLLLGGEFRNRDVQQMIRATVARSSIPAWPGWLAIISALIGLFFKPVWKK